MLKPLVVTLIVAGLVAPIRGVRLQPDPEVRLEAVTTYGDEGRLNADKTYGDTVYDASASGEWPSYGGDDAAFVAFALKPDGGRE